MKLYSKDELKVQFGKTSWWDPKHTTFGVTYVSGIPPFDDKLDDVEKDVYFVVRPKGLEIRKMWGWKWQRVAIFTDDIVSLMVEERQKIYDFKERSSLGRAVVGGALFGGTAAVVGAVSGAKDKRKELAQPDAMVLITYLEDGMEKEAVLDCPADKSLELAVFFQKHFRRKFKRLV